MARFYLKLFYLLQHGFLSYLSEMKGVLHQFSVLFFFFFPPEEFIPYMAVYSVCSLEEINSGLSCGAILDQKLGFTYAKITFKNLIGIAFNL